MKTIQYIILGIFVVSGVLSVLLFQQKKQRIQTQLDKKEVGWNAVAIKKFIIVTQGADTIRLSKNDGVWKHDQQFDGDALAQQLLIYLSTMEIDPINATTWSESDFNEEILLQSYDKKGVLINKVSLGKNIEGRKTIARLNNSKRPVILYNKQNNRSLRDLLTPFFAKVNF